MKKVTKTTVKPSIKKIRPALNPDARENQMIALAVDLAEKQLLEGTASSQVITHFLKLGSSKERLEKEKLEKENALLRVKAEALESSKNSEALYKEAMEVFKTYAGMGGQQDDPDIY